MQRYEKNMAEMFKKIEPQPPITQINSGQIKEQQSASPEIKTNLGYEIISEQPEANDKLVAAALKTVDWEARRDKRGNLSIYALPSGDLGGSYEIAGINDKYHPEAFKKISSLPPEQRERAAAEYIKEYTSPLVGKLPEQIRPFAQDLAFNRGAAGATRYIQQGLNTLGQGVAVDGKLGPKTLEAINSVQPSALMRAASDAQLQDEYRRAQEDPRRKKFIGGLENRIRNRLALFGTI